MRSVRARSVPPGVGRGARAAVRRGRSRVPRGRDPPARGPRAGAPARHGRPVAGDALGRRGRGDLLDGRRGRVGDRRLQRRVRRAGRRPRRRRPDARAAQRPVPARRALELAARGHDRSVRRGGGLGAVDARDRRVRARRHDQAPPGHLPQRCGRARRGRRRRSSTSGTTGPPTSWARRRPGGGPPTCVRRAARRRCRRASPTIARSPTSSSTR